MCIYAKHWSKRKPLWSSTYYYKTSNSSTILIAAIFEFVEIKVLPRIWCVDFKMVLYIKLHVITAFYSRLSLKMPQISWIMVFVYRNSMFYSIWHSGHSPRSTHINPLSGAFRNSLDFRSVARKWWSN